MAIKYRLFIVDDHPDVRMGLEAIIESTTDLSICGQAENAEDALREVEKLRPDLAIVDISLKGQIDGIELTRRFQQKLPAMRILILSLHDEHKYAPSARVAGAHGYLSKAASSEHILTTIREVARKGTAPVSGIPVLPPSLPKPPAASAR